jgi:putative membrane protein insertion efficiency factor
MLKAITLGLIQVYQKYVRIILPFSCRFNPSCSEYTKQAVAKYGFLQGGWKGCCRLFHCHPFSSKAGNDPLT